MTGVPEGGAASELPMFALRVSDRARRVRLVVAGDGELIVVVPRRFDRRAIPAIVEAKRTWIARARARVAARRLAAAAEGGVDESLPGRIVLAALGETWDVEYRTAAVGSGARGEGALAQEVGSARLVVTGAPGDDEACRRALFEWLRRRAARHLVPRLEFLARLHGLEFERVSVRHQRTRWASCSPGRAISLNLRLLFLPPALVDHILLHELCHTRELNHSSRFWALLQAHDPAWALHRRQAREAWRSLPAWVHARRASPRV